MATQKFRNWTFLLYPESAITGWEDVLRNKNLRVIVSPIHDQDLKDDGEVVKPHHHLIVMFPNQVRYGTVQELCKELQCPEHVETVYSLAGLSDYLTHSNNNDKVKYNAEDITYINCDSRFVLESAPYKEVLEIIKSNHFYSFKLTCDYLVAQNRIDLLRYVSNNTYFVRSYLEDKCQMDYGYFKSVVNDIYRRLEFDEPVSRDQIKKLEMLFGDYELLNS